MKSFQLHTKRAILTIKFTALLIILFALYLNSSSASSVLNSTQNAIGGNQSDTQSLNGSNLTLFVNEWLESLEIEDKMNNIVINLTEKDRDIIYTNSTIVVKGRLVSDLKENEHIWLAVNPQNSVENWWPQSGGDIKPYNREFKGNAFLGGDNQAFDIAILIVNDTLNRTLSEWEEHSSLKKTWPPITEGDPVTGKKVSGNTIEHAALIKIKAFVK